MPVRPRRKARDRTPALPEYTHEVWHGYFRELEAAVLEQLRRVLRAPAMVAGVTEHAVRLDPSLDEAQVTVAMTRLDSIWEQLFPAEQQRIVKLLIDKVIVSPHSLEVRFRPNGIEVVALELELQPEPEPVDDAVEEAVALEKSASKLLICRERNFGACGLQDFDAGGAGRRRPWRERNRTLNGSLGRDTKSAGFRRNPRKHAGTRNKKGQPRAVGLQILVEMCGI